VTSLSHACVQLLFAAAASACVDRQFGTNSRSICEADTTEQYKRSLKSWLFEYAYGRRHVW